MKSAKEQVVLASQITNLDEIRNIWVPHEDILDEIDEDDEINSDASTSEDECDAGNEDTFEDCINSDDEDEKPSLKLLEMAHLWKQKMAAASKTAEDEN